MDIYYKQPTIRNDRRAAARWGELADWIARQDRALPIYHKLCMRLWLWAFRHSVE